MNLYKVLGVAESADGEQIKQAYRKLAKKYHPDLNPENQEAEKRFKEIVDAYEILGTPEKRKQYDESQSAAGQKKKVSRPQGNPGANMGNLTKDMEAFFGFSFTEDKKVHVKKESKVNPMDMTAMFEAYMKMK